MSIGAVLMTHAIAHRHRKAPFFFSRWNFERMKERGNTHYCFHCGGSWGFTPDEDGNATNCLDDVACVLVDGERMKMREALENPELEPLIADTAGYSRRKPDHPRYDEWLDYMAHFAATDVFFEVAERLGLEVYHYNPMKDHDPETHAEAVICGANEHDWVGDWFKSLEFSEEFPYIVSVT